MINRRLYTFVALGVFLANRSPATVHYVNIGNTTPAPPYLNWDAAATNIQDAVDAATNGDLILVTNGVYQFGGRTTSDGTTNRVVVANVVTVQSVNGPAVTWIDGGKSMRCIYLTDGAVLMGFTVTNGSAGNGGGALCASTNAVLLNCLLVNNTATSGGGVYSGRLTNCTLSGNTCPLTGGNGGGAAGSTLFNCTLTGNVTGRAYPNTTGASWGGGAAGGTLNNCQLSGNSAYGAGSHGGGVSGAVLTACTLVNNYTDDQGGGAYGGTLYNCLLTGNSAVVGGGATSSTLNNCTIYGNHSAGNGGGGTYYLTANNCIIFNNTSPNNLSSTLNFCCSPDGGGTGSITNQPLFVNPAVGDFHLQSGSPCIDAGSNGYVTANTDLDGNLRIVNGRVDIGAYEFHTTSALTVTVQANYTNVVVGYPVAFTGIYTGGRSNVWNFADGSFATNQFTLAHTWTALGDYPVALTVYDDNYPGGVTGYFTVHVIAPPSAYVDPNSLNPVPPYSSWATAATNIQDAVDAAFSGYHIIVTNGTYQTGGRVVYGALTNRLVINKPVLVQSVNGPAVTIIAGNPAVGDNAVRCVYATNGVTLNGFTLTNGATRAAGDSYKEQSGGGVWCEPGNEVITNCVLSGNTAQVFAGGAYGGTLLNCSVAGNIATNSAGGAYGSTLNNCSISNNVSGGAGNCILSNCAIVANAGGGAPAGGVYNSTLDFCRLINNTANGDGAGALSSTLRNCVIAGNTSGGFGAGGNGCSFTGCLIVSNTAAVGGGTYNCNCTNSVLTRNISTYQGGGASSGTLVNCILSFNSGSTGAGASANTYGTGAALFNCAVFGNSASFGGGGLASSTAWNSIIVGNTAPDSTTNYYGLGANALNYCCTQPLPPDGVGNIAADPGFINGPDGDFHLQPGSPCINAGTNGCTLPGGDFDGNARILGGTVDLGPYEFQDPTYLTQQPQSQIAYVGQTVALQVTAISPLPLHYQWQDNGTNIPGVTNSTLLFTNVQVADSGIYNLVISNSMQVFSSAKAVLTVYYTPLVILSQPTNESVILGSNAVIAVAAYSPYSMYFQWQFNGTNLVNDGRVTGSTSSTLSLAPSQLGDAGLYEVIITNQYSSVTSSVAFLTVLGKPVFTSQPSSIVTTVFGGPQNFSAMAQAAPPFTYQWQKNGSNLLNGGGFSGVDTTNLLFANPWTTDSGQYALVASNAFGVTTSSNATLTVLPIFQWGDHYTPPPQSATNLLAVSAGGDVSWGDFDMALRADGQVIAWGSGYNGSTTVSPDATNVVAIAAGDFFGLALRQDRTVVGWGDNTAGESTPPSTATNIMAIAAGHFHSLALKADGTVIGWGENSYGESTPPAGLSNVIAIAAGGNFSLALRQDGTIVAWGYNNYGQAVPPPNATNVVAIAAGEEHALALTQDGTVIGWGFNDFGYDVVPPTATNMIAISAGNGFSSALRPDGTVLNWGYGDGGSASPPPFLAGVVATSAKEYQDLALIQDPTTQVPPTIWRQPENCAPATGQTAILSPLALGSRPMSYQWYFNGGPLTGQTNNWLALVAISTNQAGNFQVVITNNFGAVTSAVAVVSEVPGMTAQPASQVAFVGDTVTFAGAATGFGPFGYQWYLNNVPLTDSAHVSGSATTNLTILNVQSSDAGSYTLRVSNSVGATTTPPALLDVASQPTALDALVGSNVTLSVTSTGPATIFYQWQNNGTLLTNGGRVSGATNSSLLISGAQTSDSGPYQLIGMLTNNPNLAATSSVATLTVMIAAGIANQPSSQATLIGGTANFSASATGSYLGYQWFRNGLPLSDSAHFSGSTTPILTIFNVQSNDAAGYVFFASNALSSASSLTASLTPLTSLSPSIRYVNVNNTNPAAPYLDWNTAATNIQDAIDAAVAGDIITVTNGVYQTGGRVVYGAMTNRVAVYKAITVQSVNGAVATVIQGNRVLGNSAVRCVYLTNNAILAGFTLSGGATRMTGDAIKEESGGGAWCVSTNARLVGCLIISNTAWLNGGGECFGTLSNCTLAMNTATNNSVPSSFGGGSYFGLLDNCVLSNNLAGIAGGGAYSNTLNNCTLTGNLVTNHFSMSTLGGGADLCVLKNCTVSNNISTRGSGGGVEYSTANNCLVVSNYASSTGGGGDSSIFNNCSLIGNQSINYGGGAYGGILNNCLIVDNHTSSSGGAAQGSSLNNCTVAGNSAGSGSPGTLGGVSFCTGKNSIIYTNLGANSYATYMSNCCTMPALIGSYDGGGNITNAPLFVNDNSDFHLQSNSPCINSGKNSYATNSTDLDGNPRVSGGTVDIGAYEYQNPSSIISYAWLQQYGLPTDGSADYQDTDGTGMNNWQKWIAGLNPTNSASVLLLYNPVATNSPGGLTVSWQSVSNRTYYLQRSTNLLAQPTFSVIHSNIVGRAGTTSFNDVSATNNGPYFYRVGVQ